MELNIPTKPIDEKIKEAKKVIEWQSVQDIYWSDYSSETFLDVQNRIWDELWINTKIERDNILLDAERWKLTQKRKEIFASNMTAWEKIASFKWLWDLTAQNTKFLENMINMRKNNLLELSKYEYWKIQAKNKENEMIINHIMQQEQQAELKRRYWLEIDYKNDVLQLNRDKFNASQEQYQDKMNMYNSQKSDFVLDRSSTGGLTKVWANLLNTPDWTMIPTRLKSLSPWNPWGKECWEYVNDIVADKKFHMWSSLQSKLAVANSKQGTIWSIAVWTPSKAYAKWGHTGIIVWEEWDNWRIKSSNLTPWKVSTVLVPKDTIQWYTEKAINIRAKEKNTWIKEKKATSWLKEKVEWNINTSKNTEDIKDTSNINGGQKIDNKVKVNIMGDELEKTLSNENIDWDIKEKEIAQSIIKDFKSIKFDAEKKEFFDKIINPKLKELYEKHNSTLWNDEWEDTLEELSKADTYTELFKILKNKKLTK